MRFPAPSRIGVWGVGLFLIVGYAFGLAQVGVLPSGPCMAECMGASLAPAQPCTLATALCGSQARDARDPTGELRRSAALHAATIARAAIPSFQVRSLAENSVTGPSEVATETALLPGPSTLPETSSPSQDLESHHRRSTAALTSSLLFQDLWPAAAPSDTIGCANPRVRTSTPRVVHRSARERILAAVKDQPGCTFSEIRRLLGLASGTATRNLRGLEAGGALHSVRIGARRRYYLGAPSAKSPTHRLEPTQARIAELLGSSPGLSQSELARHLRLPRQNVNYAVKRLVRLGLVRLGEPTGARRPCFLTREPGTLVPRRRLGETK